MACRIENATARPERRDDLHRLLRQLFERRHHRYVTGQERMWLTVELVQSLRRQSDVYREAFSGKTEGPLPFALGYFQLQGDTLRATSDTVPAAVAPEVLVRILSEFVQPGARFTFGRNEEAAAWVIRGVNEVEREAVS